MTSFITGTGLTELAADLDAAPARVSAGAYPTMKKAGQNIKEHWQDAWKGMAHAPLLPDAISYDVYPAGLLAVELEVGPDKDRPQGALGNLIEYGSRNNAPRPGAPGAVAAELPQWEKALQDLAIEAMG